MPGVLPEYGSQVTTSGGNKQVDDGVIKAECKKHQRRHCINSDQHLPKGAV